MKIKVGNTIYDGDIEPVMVILSEQDKKNIAMMGSNAKKYCMYPTDDIYTQDYIKWWMEKE